MSAFAFPALVFLLPLIVAGVHPVPPVFRGLLALVRTHAFGVADIRLMLGALVLEAPPPLIGHRHSFRLSPSSVTAPASRGTVPPAWRGRTAPSCCRGRPGRCAAPAVLPLP